MLSWTTRGQTALATRLEVTKCDIKMPLALVMGNTSDFWPADMDAVPDKIIRANERRKQLGIEPAPYATKAQFERAVELCRQSLETESGEPLPRLKPKPAAINFLAWIRAHSRERRYSNEGLAYLYQEHCAETNRVPTGDMKMRKELSALPGVSKYQKDAKGSHGERTRNFEWIIGSEPTVAKPEIVPEHAQLRLAA